MLNQATINRLHEMRFSVMAETYRKQTKKPTQRQFSFDEWFWLMVDAERNRRHFNHIVRLMKKAILYFPDACPKRY